MNEQEMTEAVLSASRKMLHTRIIEEPHCTISVEKIQPRSWKERWFNWPWKPWIKTKIVIVQQPDPNVHVFSGYIVCHPAIARRIKDSLIQHADDSTVPIADDVTQLLLRQAKAPVSSVV